MNYNSICYRCFAEIPIAGRPCPHCGHNNSRPQMSPNCLPAGTLLNNRYIIGVALGVGGFGITYKCYDTGIGGVCAVKEYFPSIYVVRNSNRRTVDIHTQKLEKFNRIMDRFVEESQILKSFHHDNIIKVYDSFFANKTAYYVMEYCDGIDLRTYTNNFTTKLGYNEGLNIMYQTMNGLEYIHSRGVLHRDIAPDNIYITNKNTVKILDFGSARHEMDQLNRELSVIVKAGYAPIEQYGGRGLQGPYTDIYALGATMYHLFTGVIPIESTQRVSDDRLIPFSKLRPDLPYNLRACIETSMNIRIQDRFQNIYEMKNMMGISHVIISKSGSNERERNGGAINPSKPKASISLRLCAYMLDNVIYGMIYSALIYFLIPDYTLSFVIWCMFPIVAALINIVTEAATGATLGKGIMRIHVLGNNGLKASPTQIILRNIIKLLGIFVIIFSKNGDLLDDRLTNSRVYVK